jgi:hypothetical protein
MSEIPKEKPCLRNRVPPCPARSVRSYSSRTSLKKVEIAIEGPDHLRAEVSIENGLTDSSGQEVHKLTVKLASMRKHLITPKPQDFSSPNEDWLDLESAAVVEVTSEEKGYPVESALISGEMQGWPAADSGAQTIRLVFDVHNGSGASGSCLRKPGQSAPKNLCCTGFSDGGHSFGEIVRQQSNFSPPDTTRELSEVAVLELVIVPDKSRGERVRASLKSLRLA